MAHDPKLEIYKLKLFRKENNKEITFAELFRNKFAGYPTLPRPIEKKDIFNFYFQNFIRSLDLKAYKIGKNKKKGFTLAADINDKGEKRTQIDTPKLETFTISGLLEGGKHGIKRWLGKVDNTEEKETITPKNIVNDRFFFLIHTPLDHSEGFIMIQGYTESNISDVFREYLLEYFKHLKDLQSKVEIFVPESLKNRYLNQATFKSVKFTSSWIVDANFKPIQEKEYELEVKIEIIDKNSKKIKYTGFKRIIEFFGNSKFKPEGGEEKRLDQFSKKNAKMVSKNKEFPIHFDDENFIKPVILLANEGISIDDEGIPNFDQIRAYCNKLLDEILIETLPTNAVKEL